MPYFFGLPVVENFIADSIPHDPIKEAPMGMPPSVRKLPVNGNSGIATGVRRYRPYFIEASSSELKQQIRKLVAGQIDELPKPPPGTRRIVIASPASAGERRFCLQLGDAMAKLGHEWCVCSNRIASMAEKMNANLFISSAFWEGPPPPRILSLLYIHSPGCVSPENYHSISAYDNFLFAQSGTNDLEEYFRKNGKNFRALKTYLTLSKTKFCDSPKKRIVYVGFFNEPRRRDEFAKLFQLLDETGYCEFYGPKHAWHKSAPHSWKREMPLRDLRDVQNVMEPAGIALLLHAKQQFESGSPVYRDFEALSSSCIIITEKTAFMQKNFGDCVLFIDTDKPVDEIFEQIDNHVKWIHAHPEEAVEMARKSHKIFCDKFSLEGECEKILKFVDEISTSQARPSGEAEPESQIANV
ncbi:MAG: hypothetical protein LBD72_02850 [Puniceicoccales bacterium]|nr:hypothetical protein [Puniceicoccales bacterium]